MGAPLTRERHVSRPDVQHIIHATSDPVVPILIPAASVAGEVVAWVHFEICLLVPLVVAEHGAADASGNHPCQIEPFWVNKLQTHFKNDVPKMQKCHTISGFCFELKPSHIN